MTKTFLQSSMLLVNEESVVLDDSIIAEAAENVEAADVVMDGMTILPAMITAEGVTVTTTGIDMTITAEAVAVAEAPLRIDSTVGAVIVITIEIAMMITAEAIAEAVADEMTLGDEAERDPLWGMDVEARPPNTEETHREDTGADLRLAEAEVVVTEDEAALAPDLHLALTEREVRPEVEDIHAKTTVVAMTTVIDAGAQRTETCTVVETIVDTVHELIEFRLIGNIKSI